MRNNGRGFSLIEIFLVIAIAAILLCLVLPALVRSREQGHEASDINTMRQVAMAGAMYQDNTGEYPLRIEQLVDSQMIPKEMCKLALDPLPTGLANYVMTDLSGLDHIAKTAPEYPQSFVTLGSFGNPISRVSEYMSRPNAGWSFADLDVKPLGSTSAFWGDRYYRIRVDGSVERRTVPKRVFNDPVGGEMTSIEFDEFFFDPPR